MAAIKLEKVQKWFGDVKVIPELDLEIAAGDFLVLVGPSGCGKTTTMRMIAGLEDVSGGRILIEGEDVTGLAPSERGLSMVFQSYALYPHMTVAENMGFGLKNLGAPADAIKAKVAEAASILRLDQLLERRPKALSGGQRQRVAIGRAIVREPKAFLFDEPLSNLDAALRVEMRFEIGRLHRQLGKTMIYVTHDQVEAMTLADKIVLMDKGEIVQAGTPRDLYERPANLFAARFIGSPRMNILPCELQSGRYVHKDALAGEHRLPEGSEAAWLGIRPEHIELVAAGDGTASCRGKVELVEYLGAETYVYVGCPQLGRLTVRVDEYKNDAEEVGLRFDPQRTHFFGKDERAVAAQAGKPAKVPKKTFGEFMSDFEKWCQEHAPSQCLYRGQNRDYSNHPNSLGHQVTSSLRRFLPENAEIPVEHLEETIVTQAKQVLDRPDANNLEILTDIQHYRGRTNCIDFTSNPHVALFFACYGRSDKDGELIFLDRASLERLDKVDYPGLSEQIRRASSGHVALIEPSPETESERRIASQDSVFVRSTTGFIPEALYKTEKIPSHLKKEILAWLRDDFGISSNSMFKDLPGFIANEENFETSALEYAKAQHQLNLDASYRKFLKALGVILEKDPGYSLAYFEMGRILFKQGDYESAHAVFSEALKGKYPTEACWRWRGRTYILMGQPEKALKDLGEISDQHKTHGDYLLLANIGLQLNDPAASLENLDKAIAINEKPEYLRLRRILKRRMEQGRT